MSERNEQEKLSDADALRLANLQLRGQLLEKERAILALETRLFQQQLHATYGNPGEAFEVAPDMSLIRRPAQP